MVAEVVEMADGLVQVRTENPVKSVGTKNLERWKSQGTGWRGIDASHREGREQVH